MIKDISKLNETFWDQEAKAQRSWSKPVSSSVIMAAKNGEWSVHVTKKAIPKTWLPTDIKGKKILCLASAGGQQAPVLAAAGADVTVYDISAEQLTQDMYVAKRDLLKIKTVQGDMRDLNQLESEYFDFIVHPISNLYVPDILSVWKESYRFLKTKGVLISSFYNPILFVFERNEALSSKGLLKPKFSIPYSDTDSLDTSEYQDKIQKGEAIVFGHSLSEQINGQIEAGFSISGFYEDEHPNPRFLIESFIPTMIATKAVKL